MASSPSSGSISSFLVPSSSGSEENLEASMMEQRKKKRMVSNRESARRSRMRKQKHLDDLTAQASRLRTENHQIMARVGVTAQHLMSVEAENSVLRAQVEELSHRLRSLDDIIISLTEPAVDSSMVMSPLNLSYFSHPIMASSSYDAFQY